MYIKDMGNGRVCISPQEWRQRATWRDEAAALCKLALAFGVIAFLQWVLP